MTTFDKQRASAPPPNDFEPRDGQDAPSGSGSFGRLFKDLKEEAVTLVKQEAALARAEVTEKITQAGRDAVKVPIGGLVAYLGVGLVLVGLCLLISYGLAAAGLDTMLAQFISFTAVGLIIGVIGYVMTSQAASQLKHDDVTPRKTIQSLKETTQWVKDKTHDHA